MNILYFDGKAQPNPGSGSAAACLYNNDAIVFKVGKYLEYTTNNQAEYLGLIVGLKKCVELGIKDLSVKGDSNLVIKQCSGLWKTKDSNIIALHKEVEDLKKHFTSIEFIHVLREFNKEADALTNSIYANKTHLNYEETKVVEIKSKHIQQDIRIMLSRDEILPMEKEEPKPEKIHLLNAEQQAVLEQVFEGKNVFCTGPGGVGKSMLIRELRRQLEEKGKTVAVTSLTGMAAVLIGAQTIHSWSGIGIGTRTVDDYFEFIRKCQPKIREAWRTTNILIIDEISMMSDEIFEKLDLLGQKLRWNEKPFGGLQIVCLGDFYQLPPINAKFVFESAIWNKTLDVVVTLDQIYRQKDPVFQNMLNEIRIGCVSDETDRLLKSRLGLDFSKEEIQPTKVFARRDMVDAANKSAFDAVDGETFTYNVTTKIKGKEKKLSDAIQKSIEKLDTNAGYVHNLILKVGAQVMLKINLNVDLRLVNGRMGIVKNCKPSYVCVLFKGDTVETTIKCHEWVLEDYKKISRVQIPLVLAYAINIHNSQGSTLDSAYIDIGSNVFEYNQSYVALSRVKSLDSLYLHSYSRHAIRAHPKVLAYYTSLN
jgi:ATP-dependent DNA helicase PIF1